jgi:uncharacterized membrane protein YhaH (DUF805 family)
MNWYLGVLRKYAEFSGRARRKEYWMFALFNAIVSFAIAFTGGFYQGLTGSESIGTLFSGLGVLYSLGVLVPSLAVGVRRLHDTGRSGWFLLLALVPILGWIAILVFLVQDGNPGANAFGPSPKEPVLAVPVATVAQ